MPASYALNAVIASGGFTGTGQAANTEVSIGDLGVIPANFLSPGTMVEFSVGCRGSLVNNSSPRNMQLRLRMGGLTGVILFDTSMLALPVSTLLTSSPMLLRGHFTQRTSGASGQASCVASMPNRFFSTANDKTHPFPLSLALSTYDTTVQQAVTLTVTESSGAVADQFGMESSMLVAFKV